MARKAAAAKERRRHHKIEELGLAEHVAALLAKPGVTYQDVVDELHKQHGVTVGKSSVARFNDSIVRRMEKVARVRETAMAIVGAAKDATDLDTELSDVLLNVTQASLLDRLGDEELSVGDVADLARAGSMTVTAKGKLEALKARERARAAEAWESATAELREILEQDAELWARVERVLVAHAAKAKAAE